jgi:hypothetical protein
VAVAADAPPVYISGDFESACRLLQAQDDFRPFDYVVTAETIYNLRSAEQLLRGADACLAEGGTLLLAAKSHYFGVGGGLAAFKQLVQRHGRFAVTKVVRIDDQGGNVREILHLRRHK